MARQFFLVTILLSQMLPVDGFLGLSTPFLGSTICSVDKPHHSSRNDRLLTIVHDQRWNREIEEISRKKAQGGGVGETVAGAVLGSLLLGPFGTIFGASIGANLGARKAEMEAKKAEMERLGISQDILDMAQDVAMSLEKSIEGKEAVRSSFETQQRLAKLLDEETTSLYKKAKQALDDSNEELARKLLFERTTVQEKLKKVLILCTEEKGRLQKMEENIAQLEKRAIEIESLLRRTVSANSLQGTAELDIGLSLRSEDPLLQKFKDLGID